MLLNRLFVKQLALPCLLALLGACGSSSGDSVCGDGTLSSDEACDDGNELAGDGCASDCTIEPGWSCDDEPSFCAPVCGDGTSVGDEACDDGNLDAGDGCDASCLIEPGWSCDGEPSTCLPWVTVERDGLAEPILDNVYDGTVESMSCVELLFEGSAGRTVGDGIVLEVGVDHPYVGDLTVRVVGPDSTPATVLQRPAGDLDNPLSDDGEGCCGDDSDLAASTPILFEYGVETSAEEMGLGLSDAEVVGASGPAAFYPVPDQAADGSFDDLYGETVDGTWRVCFGDSDPFDIGSVASVRLSLETR